MRKRLLSLAICIATVGHTNVVNAQSATPLSLQQCIDYALKNNASVKNAKIDVDIQKAQNDQTTSATYPKISGKLEFDDFINPQKTIIDGKSFGQPGTYPAVSFSLPYGTSAGITASQLLFDGSVFVALQARNSVMELARLNGKLTEETVRYNVQKAYYALVIARRQFNIVKKGLAYSRDLAKDVLITQQSGYAEKIDVDRSNVQVNNLATDSLKIANLLTLSEQVLKFQMGMNINEHIILTDTSIEDHLLKASALANEATDYNKRIEYNMFNTQLKLNEYNVQRYKLNALPSLAAFGALGYNYAATTFSNVMQVGNYLFNSMVGLQLNVPIFSGMLRLNQLKEANLNIQKTKNNIDNMKLVIDFQAAQSRSTLTNSLLQMESQQRNMDLANSVLDLAGKKYKAGVGSNVEVTQAQTGLLQAQNNYFSSLLDVVYAETDLQKVLGQLK